MLKPIKTEKEYQAALARVYELMQGDVKEDLSASDELDALSTLVNAYEQAYYPVRASI